MSTKGRCYICGREDNIKKPGSIYFNLESILSPNGRLVEVHKECFESYERERLEAQNGWIARVRGNLGPRANKL
jgi:hypothetical protein